MPATRQRMLWADPRQPERWWGPPSHPATVEKHDLVAGREVSYFMTGPDGEVSRGWWRATSIDPPASLEFTDGWANQDGTPSIALELLRAQPFKSGVLNLSYAPGKD